VIDVALTLEQIRGRDLYGATCAVVDVLRTTTCMSIALARGAQAVIPAASEDEARRVAALLPPSTRLLAGERGARRLPGFDLGNSPFEYLRAPVAGRTVVVTTSNGCPAVLATTRARHSIVASLANAPAAARTLSELDPYGEHTLVVCAGRRGGLAIEDALCAGLLVHLLASRRGSGRLTDEARACLSIYTSTRGNVLEAVVCGESARHLESIGLSRDVAYCARIGTVDAVPFFRSGLLILPGRSGMRAAASLPSYPENPV